MNIDAQGAQFDEDGGAFDVSRVSLSTALMVGGAGYFAGQRAVDALRRCKVQVQVRRYGSLNALSIELLGRLRVLCVAVFVTASLGLLLCRPSLRGATVVFGALVTVNTVRTLVRHLLGDSGDHCE